MPYQSYHAHIHAATAVESTQHLSLVSCRLPRLLLIDSFLYARCRDYSVFGSLPELTTATTHISSLLAVAKLRQHAYTSAATDSSDLDRDSSTG